MRWLLLILMLPLLSLAADEAIMADSNNTQEGSLNTNTVGSTVSSNNQSEDKSVSNTYNGAGSSSDMPVGSAIAPTYMSNGTFSGQVRVYDISEVVSIEETDENLNSNRELIKVYDLLGRETVPQINTFQIYKYSDGTTEKKFVLKD